MHLLPKPQQRLLSQLRSNHHCTDPSNVPTGPDELDVYVGFNRLRVFKNFNFEENDELSDYVKIRLLISRLKALEVYHKVHG
jgi:hypothetical protein